MIDFAGIATAFILGLLTPLGALCVLPVYPGFLAFLAGRMGGEKPGGKHIPFLGLVVVSGVIFFMLLFGLLFSTVLQVSLTNVIGIISPAAFFVLAAISVLLILNVDFGRLFPKINAPIVKNPLSSALIFGFFFGAIVLPCNPAFIAALLARSVLIASPIENILNFLFFGLGIGAPLLLLSVVSAASGNALLDFMAKHKRKINLAAGTIMLAISLYYLLFVFAILG
ncbi:MAG: cytochrome c biogenesis protein CcdA [Candidatus Diapherotrites archaeon]